MRAPMPDCPSCGHNLTGVLAGHCTGFLPAVLPDIGLTLIDCPCMCVEEITGRWDDVDGLWKWIRERGSGSEDH